MTQDVEMKDEEALPQAPLPSDSASILQREHQTLESESQSQILF